MTDFSRISEDFKIVTRIHKEQTGHLYAGRFTAENEKTEHLDKIAEKYILGQSIVYIRDNDENVVFTLSNGMELIFNSNEGSTNSYNGWYTSDGVFDTRDSGDIVTKIEVKSPKDAKDGTYSVLIYSNDKRIIKADFCGWGDEQYGVGIWAELIIPENVLTKLSNCGEI